MKFKTIAFAGLSLCFIYACKGNNSQETENSDGESISLPSKEVVNENPQKKVTLPMIVTPNVYLENSASMKGYNDKNCNGFTSVMSELVGVYGRSHTKAYFYSDGLSKAYDANKFADMVASKQVKYGNSSPIHIIIDSIIKKNNSISFLITDGIMSGSDEQIRNNPQYNINYREELQNSLSDKIKGKGLAASIYQFESFYNGTYYCYDNTKIELSQNRPFYVIALGKKTCIIDFKNKAAKELSYFKPKNEVHFGIYDFPVPISIYAGVQGKIDSTNNIISVEPAKIRKYGKEISGQYNLDLSVPLPDYLPTYMKTKEYIETNLSIHFNDEELDNEKQIFYNETTETLHIYIGLQEILKDNSLHIAFKYSLPAWCKKESTDNDKNIKSEMFPTTFNLEYLIKGLQNGIEPTINEIMNVQFKIKK